MRFFPFILCVFLSLLVNSAQSQFLEFDASINVSRSNGDDLSPAWSPDGLRLLFQSNRNGNWDIFVYYVETDTLEQITSSDENERNPVWIENGNSIVFDSDISGEERLYKMHMKTGKAELLFDRKIRAKEASFPKTEKLVYFSGFDPVKSRWEIYSFEFYYENLNQLTGLAQNNSSPEVSPDEDHIVFTNSFGNFPHHQLHLMNWYGDDRAVFSKFHANYPSWDNSGLKVYFVSRKESRSGDVYSMWVDGSHLEKITSFDSEIRHPVVSPDGNFLALSIAVNGSFNIYILSLEDY